MADEGRDPGREERRRSWDERHATRQPIEASRPDALLVGEADRLVPGRALDVACGEGRNAIWLAERGWRVTAVDFSAVALRHARERAGAAGVQVEWLERDLLDWVPPARAFDLVSVVYLHLPPDERATVLARLAASVATGGQVVVVGHHRRNPEVGGHGPQDPRVLHDPDVIADELGRGGRPDDGGLVVERAEPVVTEDEGGRRIDSLVVARREA